MKALAVLVAALAISGAAIAQEAEPAPPAVLDYARAFLTPLAAEPELQAAIAASTKKHSKLTWDETRALDREWKNERVADFKDRTVLDAVMGSGLSAWLIDKQASAPNGAVTGVVVIDGLGWNVGQTRPTSDFYQGDKPSWQNALTASDAVASSIEDGDGRRLVQVAFPIRREDSTIGVITLELDVDRIR